MTPEAVSRPRLDSDEGIYILQSGPVSDVGFQVKVSNTIEGLPSFLETTSPHGKTKPTNHRFEVDLDGTLQKGDLSR